MIHLFVRNIIRRNSRTRL